jgi:hypothetical protein
MDEHIDKKICDLFSRDKSQFISGLTWEHLRKEIAEPDSRIATRLLELRKQGKILTNVIYSWSEEC